MTSDTATPRAQDAKMFVMMQEELRELRDENERLRTSLPEGAVSPKSKDAALYEMLHEEINELRMERDQLTNSNDKLKQTLLQSVKNQEVGLDCLQKELQLLRAQRSQEKSVYDEAETMIALPFRQPQPMQVENEEAPPEDRQDADMSIDVSVIKPAPVFDMPKEGEEKAFFDEMYSKAYEAKSRGDRGEEIQVLRAVHTVCTSSAIPNLYNETKVLRLLAEALVATNEVEYAEQVYKALLAVTKKHQLRAENVKTKIALGNLAHAQGRFDEASEYYQAARLTQE